MMTRPSPYPRAVTLRDGLPVTLRAPEPEDAPDLLACQRAVIIAGEGVVMTLDDLDDLEAFDARFRRRLAAPTLPEMSIALVGLRDGVVIASAGARRLSPGLVRHVATLDLEVHPRLQGLGLGGALMDALLEWARDVGVVRFELNVRADNARAQALYRSRGFQVEGRRARFLVLPDGRHVDDLTMVRFLDVS